MNTEIEEIKKNVKSLSQDVFWLALLVLLIVSALLVFGVIVPLIL